MAKCPSLKVRELDLRRRMRVSESYMACGRGADNLRVLFAVVDVYRKKGDEVADDGDSCNGHKDVPWRNNDRIGLYHETARHLDETEMLLEQCKSYTCNQAGEQTRQRNHPAFQHKYASYELVCCTDAAKGLDVVFFLDYEH